MNKTPDQNDAAARPESPAPGANATDAAHAANTAHAHATDAASAAHANAAHATDARKPGRLDVISCGIGFPHDAATLTLLEKAEVLYGSRTLLERCPITEAERRVIGAQARRDASDALAAARAGRRVVALASGDALYHGFGGTLHALAGPEDAITYHPGITAFQAFFHRIGQPWDEARLFSAHGGEEVPAREIAESRLAVAYGGSRHNAADIARAVLAFHPGAARRRAVIAERLGSPDERIIAGTLEDAARLHCGPTSILALFPDTCEEETPLDTQTGPASRLAEEAAPAVSALSGVDCMETIPGDPALSGVDGAETAPDVPASPDVHGVDKAPASQNPGTPGSSPVSGDGRRTDAGGPSPASSFSPQAAPILPLGLPEEDYERENNLITASDVRAVILSRLRLPAWGTLWDIGAGSGSVGLEAAGLRPGLHVCAVERQPGRCALIERNRLRLGVPNYTLYNGDALEAVRALGPSEMMPNGNNQDATTPGQSAPDARPLHQPSPAFPSERTPDAQPPHQSNVLGRDGGPGEGTTLLQKGFPSPGSRPTPLLPDPDRVFIGGGGKDLPDLLDACMERLKPGGLMVAGSVTLESFCALYGWRPGRRVGLCRLDVANERPIAGTHRHLKHQNTITLFIFQKEIPL